MAIANYTINFSNLDKNSLIVPAGTRVPLGSIELVGQGSLEWGTKYNQSLLNIYENFASKVAPAAAASIEGQLWCETGEQYSILSTDTNSNKFIIAGDQTLIFNAGDFINSYDANSGVYLQWTILSATYDTLNTNITVTTTINDTITNGWLLIPHDIYLHVFNGGDWTRVNHAIFSKETPLNPKGGDIWWDTFTENFKVYNGSSFITMLPLTGGSMIGDLEFDNGSEVHSTGDLTFNTLTVPRLELNTTGAQVTMPGSAINPSFQLNDLSTGLFNDGSGISHTVGGNLALTVNVANTKSAGELIATTEYGDEFGFGGDGTGDDVAIFSNAPLGRNVITFWNRNINTRMDIRVKDIDAPVGNITTVNSTTVGAVTGNITTVNSTTVDTTNIEVDDLAVESAGIIRLLSTTSDPMYIRNFENAPNVSSLRVSIGDDAGTADKLEIGYDSAGFVSKLIIDAAGNLIADGNVTSANFITTGNTSTGSLNASTITATGLVNTGTLNASGIISGPRLEVEIAGTKDDPSLYWSQDSNNNTGMYFAGENHLKVTTGGNDDINFIDGQITIGPNTSTYPDDLVVRGKGTGNGTIRLMDHDDAFGHAIQAETTGFLTITNFANGSIKHVIGHELHSDISYNTNLSFVGVFGVGVASAQSDKAGSDTFSLITTHASGDRKHALRGDGVTLADGTYSSGGADFAEAFEWQDGNTSNEDRIGKSIIIDNGQIRFWQSGDPDPDGIITTEELATVIGNTAPNKWYQKYNKDSFGRIQYETVDRYLWTDDIDSNIKHSYWFDEVPIEITLPAVYTTESHPRPQLNPVFDPDLVYVPRLKRQEWDAAALHGIVKLYATETKAAHWKKLRDVDASVEEYYIFPK